MGTCPPLEGTFDIRLKQYCFSRFVQMMKQYSHASASWFSICIQFVVVQIIHVTTAGLPIIKILTRAILGAKSHFASFVNKTRAICIAHLCQTIRKSVSCLILGFDDNFPLLVEIAPLPSLLKGGHSFGKWHN